MTPTDLINHARLCTLEEVRLKLERLQVRDPEKYEVVENFLLSCKPTIRPPKELAIDP